MPFQRGSLSKVCIDQQLINLVGGEKYEKEYRVHHMWSDDMNAPYQANCKVGHRLGYDLKMSN